MRVFSKNRALDKVHENICPCQEDTETGSFILCPKSPEQKELFVHNIPPALPWEKQDNNWGCPAAMILKRAALLHFGSPQFLTNIHTSIAKLAK